MPAKNVVDTTFRARDKTSRVLEKMGRNSARFGRTTTRSFQTASSAATKFRTILGGVLGAQVISRGMMLMSQGLRATVDEFLDFDQAITSAGAKFKTMVERGTYAFDELRESTLKAIDGTEFFQAEGARAMEFYAMAGIDAAQATALLPKTLDLATVSGGDMARAVDIATDSLGAFGLMTEDTSQLTTNLARVNDVFAKTITTSNTDLEQLFETAKFAGPVFTTAGQSIETFAASAGVMASSGIKASLAGTQLRTAMLNLSAPVPKAAKLLKKLKVEVKDSHGNLRDFYDILEDISNGTAKMGTAQRAAALNTIFGKRAVAGMSILLDKGAGALREYRKQLEESKGSAEKMAENMRKSFRVQLTQVKKSLIDIGFKVIESFQDKFPRALKSASDSIKNFDVKKLINGMDEVVFALRTMSDTIKQLMPGIVAAFVSLFVLLAPAKLVAAGIALKALWVAMAANPVGAVLLLITSIVSLFAVISDNWEYIKNGFVEIWTSAKNAFLDFAIPVLEFLTKITGRIASALGFDNVASGASELLSRLNKLHTEVKIDRRGGEFAGMQTGPKHIYDEDIEYEMMEGMSYPQGAPNEAEVRAKQSFFSGRLDVSMTGPLTGRFEEQRGVPGFDVGVLGANP